MCGVLIGQAWGHQGCPLEIGAVAQHSQSSGIEGGADTGQAGTSDAYPGPKTMLQEPGGAHHSTCGSLGRLSKRKGHLELGIEG